MVASQANIRFETPISTRLSITERTTGARLSSLLRDLAAGDNEGLVEGVLAASRDLAACEAEIAAAEAAMNAVLFDLYGLTEEERRMVLAG